MLHNCELYSAFRSGDRLTIIMSTLPWGERNFSQIARENTSLPRTKETGLFRLRNRRCGPICQTIRLVRSVYADTDLTAPNAHHTDATHIPSPRRVRSFARPQITWLTFFFFFLWHRTNPAIVIAFTRDIRPHRLSSPRVESQSRRFSRKRGETIPRYRCGQHRNTIPEIEKAVAMNARGINERSTIPSCISHRLGAKHGETRTCLRDLYRGYNTSNNLYENKAIAQKIFDCHWYKYRQHISTFVVFSCLTNEIFLFPVVKTKV